MRRAALVLCSTAAGLAALFSFKAHAPMSAAAAPSTPAAPAAASPATTRPATTRPAAPARTRTISSPVVATEFGHMQIKLTVVGGRITRVTVVQQTENGAQSQADSFAVPTLTG
jgi:uncharacterized protein with FMN-binding domain